MAPLPTDPLTPDEQELLKVLARIVLTVPRDFAADLGRKAGVSLSEYHVLMHLSEDGEAGVRMGDLAARTGLTLGAVTRVMRELEAKGLAERRRSAADGRVQEAHLTDAGRERLVEAAPVHHASARHHIFERLSGAQVAALTEALRAIAHAGLAPGARGEEVARVES